MKNRIIVDSCCNLTAEMKHEMGIISVPLTMILGEKEFRDDESLDMNEFRQVLRQFTGKVSSASPSPFLYQEAIESSEDAYIITLSSKLSGLYNNVKLGNDGASENGLGAACLFDSKSASAGETLIALNLYELIQTGTPKDIIVKMIHQYIKEMQTYFVLERYDNLQNNGRLNKVIGTTLQILNIKLIMGADGNGEIALFRKCRGTKHTIQQLLSLIESSGKNTQNKNLVISHCNNHDLAEQLRAHIRNHFIIKNHNSSHRGLKFPLCR